MPPTSSYVTGSRSPGPCGEGANPDEPAEVMPMAFGGRPWSAPAFNTTCSDKPRLLATFTQFNRVASEVNITEQDIRRRRSMQYVRQAWTSRRVHTVKRVARMAHHHRATHPGERFGRQRVLVSVGGVRRQSSSRCRVDSATAEKAGGCVLRKTRCQGRDRRLRASQCAVSARDGHGMVVIAEPVVAGGR
jgi:hypothetical protein